MNSGLLLGRTTSSMDVYPLATTGDAPLPPPVHRTPSSDEETPDPNATQDSPNTQDQPSDAGSPRRPRRAQAPDLEDALTRLTQTVERMAAIQRPQQPVAVADVAEDPDFNWNALRSPLETTFPLPATGVVQRIAAGLYAKVHSGVLTGRGQREARFVLDMMADWPDMDVDLRTRVFQRLNVYAIVATHGWPTAIAATAASNDNTQCLLPPGVQPVVQQPRQQQQRRGGRRANTDAAVPQPVKPPAPQPAARGGRGGGRRRNN